MTRKEELLQTAIRKFPRFAERRVGFIAGAEWADKTMIDKACEWLNHNMPMGTGSDIWEDVLNDFRKAMEDKP